MRWFEENLNRNRSNQDYDTVRIIPHGTGKVGLHVAGPNSGKLMEKITDADTSSEAFRFMDIQEINMAWYLVWWDV
ncbi:MAG: hypothetical protein CM1200mP30_15450 [Pseudomonadota bacterium]|nr:MAG: hypothetical protein CM1200mP30_15450 [Pseudomonadota bacterium]